MTTTNDYPDLKTVDLAIGRAWMRHGLYEARGETVSADGQIHVLTRLLDLRLVLMAERDGVPA